MVEGGVAVEGMDSSQPLVPGADAVASLALEVVEERCDVGGVQVLEAEPG